MLPRQSPLGWVGPSQYLYTAIWPILVFCSQVSRVSEVQRTSVQLATETLMGPEQRASSLWEIRGACRLENCGRHHRIYTHCRNIADPNSVLQSFMGAKPSITCLGGHSAKFHRDHLTLNRLTGP
jgi:hypothetical protein